jgi:hypothetical protein
MTDIEKIGKYKILERIGRGGMGTIFKAHDPILNRAVALKVISTDLDVTDEIRARFFREAQACARLSHPNIVTVYDMGEDSGRLFIVMELLEGVELRRLITDRTPMALEDKLAVMIHVCDGLAYAHQRGIVHRDIKPGNIMRLRNGQVKILDFGIAQMESVQESLTRTGLIMGTLRYMAPEQIRGRADHRADIFAVGAVLHEFLALQPPFNASDPIQLIEQLRAEDPTPLHVLDPTIPPELSDIVAWAMRKDPAERASDLVEVRARIERLQRTLAAEAQRVDERVRARRDQLRRLEAALASRVGAPREDQTAILNDPRTLAALQALEADLAARIEVAEGLLARADALAPAFTRGDELLKAGRLADAARTFEDILKDMPEHAGAAESLASARAAAEAGAVVDDAALRQEADAAVRTGEAAHVGDLEEKRRDMAASADEEAAAAALARDLLGSPSWAPETHGRVETSAGERRLHDGAGVEDDRTRVEEPRDRARTAVTPTPPDGEPEPSMAGSLRAGQIPSAGPAPAKTWSGRTGENLSPAQGPGGVRWILAGVGGLAALVLLVVFVSRSPEVPPGSQGPPRASVQAQAPGVPSAGGGPSADAPPRRSPGRDEPARGDADRPASAQAQATSVRAGESEPPGSEAGQPAPPVSRRADEPGTPGRSAEPEPAGAKVATTPPAAEPPASRRASEPGAPNRSPEAEQAQSQAVMARRAAEQAGAPFYTPKLLASAQAKEREGMAALRRSDHSAAIRLLGEARADYQAAAQEARREAEKEQQIAPLRASVDQARGAALARRQQALAAGAEQRATTILRAAETRHAEADGLAARQSLADAARAYEEAAQRYGDAALRAQAPPAGGK